MNLAEYQQKARSTAIYLDVENNKFIYPALGIIGECGEVAEKVKKTIRDGKWEITSDRATTIAQELGDCCWYLANICCDIDRELDMLYKMRGVEIFQSIASLTLPQLVICMNLRAGIIASSLERCHSEGNHKFQDMAETFHSISTIMACIENIAKKCGFTIEEICVMNVEKLAGRKKRGTLKGDGDTR